MTDFTKAFAQLLTDPKLWKVLLFSVLLSLVAFLALWQGLAWGAELLAKYYEIESRWLSLGGWVGTFVAALFLYPATFGIVVSFFQERIADVVEARHYPHLKAADGSSILTGLRSGVKYFLLLIALNALAAPVYLFLMIFAGFGALAFWVVNGILCGREYYEIVALRRHTIAQAREIRRAHRFKLFLTGLGIVMLGSVPLLGLVVPVVGVAAMVHRVHSLTPPTPPAFVG